ncbi:putative phage tail protein [Acetobacter senegalensis]|uniref:putative phage tail protein n=1 Tax=Acetobacter senegalensis TaxID=446692 RepID=UPI002654832E|nr:putative phage tail protein [Acetobacter senegalensis]MDN7351753.1 DUF2313 domain-containing protein [Acetobacter senegalensis]
MSRTPEQIRDEWLHDLMPPGALERSPDGNLARFLLAFAGPLATLESDIEELSSEISPQTATTLLSDYEAVLGADACGCASAKLTLEQRQASAFQRWVLQSDISLSGLVRSAEALGFGAQIEEPQPAQCGVAVCGQARCASDKVRFIWIMTVRFPAGANYRADAAISGRGVCGSSICGAVLTDDQQNALFRLGCSLKRAAPAHTHPIIKLVR